MHIVDNFSKEIRNRLGYAFWFKEPVELCRRMGMGETSARVGVSTFQRVYPKLAQRLSDILAFVHRRIQPHTGSGVVILSSIAEIPRCIIKDRQASHAHA